MVRNFYKQLVERFNTLANLCINFQQYIFRFTVSRVHTGDTETYFMYVFGTALNFSSNLIFTNVGYEPWFTHLY